jgi:hypothetical protein
MGHADFTTTAPWVKPVSALACSAKMRYQRRPMPEHPVSWTV